MSAKIQVSRGDEALRINKRHAENDARVFLPSEMNDAKALARVMCASESGRGGFEPPEFLVTESARTRVSRVLVEHVSNLDLLPFCFREARVDHMVEYSGIMRRSTNLKLRMSNSLLSFCPTTQGSGGSDTPISMINFIEQRNKKCTSPCCRLLLVFVLEFYSTPRLAVCRDVAIHSPTYHAAMCFVLLVLRAYLLIRVSYSH